jgi:hypothetical protein
MMKLSSTSQERIVYKDRSFEGLGLDVVVEGNNLSVGMLSSIKWVEEKDIIENNKEN